MQILYIYEITNDLDGRNYIGQRHCPLNKTPETDDYMGSGVYLKNSQNKHGIENFSKKILAVCYNQKILNALEHELISIYRSIGKAEYNIADGGNQFLINGKPWNYGVPMSEESKAKMIKTKLENPIEPLVRQVAIKKMKSHYNDENYCKAHSEKIKNEKFYEAINSPEYKKKISDSSKRMWSDENKKKEIGKKISNNTKGIPKSENARKNISIAMRNSTAFKEKMASTEHKEKLSYSIRNSKKHYDSHHNSEFIAKMKEIASHRSEKQKEQAKRFGKCMIGMKRYTTPERKHTYCKPSEAPSNWLQGWV